MEYQKSKKAIVGESICCWLHPSCGRFRLVTDTFETLAQLRDAYSKFKTAAEVHLFNEFNELTEKLEPLHDRLEKEVIRHERQAAKQVVLSQLPRRVSSRIQV